MTYTGGRPLQHSLTGRQFEPLTREREQELGAIIRQALADGDTDAETRVRHELVERHLRLVHHIASRYLRTLDLDEGMAVGALGLTQAASRWHPEKGQMYPWAERWITTALTRAADGARAIRIPQQVAYQAALVEKRAHELEETLGRLLTADERAAVAGGVKTFAGLPSVIDSLDRPAGQVDSRGTFGESLADGSAGVHETVEESMTAQAVRNALEELSPLEQAVIRSRFGIGGAERMTLAELGVLHGATGEAMRRVEAAGLAKMRHPALGHHLEE